MNQGVWYALAAYVTWGFFPVYFKWLQRVPAWQVVCHRIVWSFIMLMGMVLLLKQWRTLRRALAASRVLTVYGGCALLIGINWLVFLWAVNNGRIVEASLGYFINPLVSVFLGVIFLHERLRRRQWLAVALAAAGVALLTQVHGAPPWVALTLAFTFGTYGLLKKTAPLGAFHGLTIETALLLVPALAALAWAQHHGNSAFLNEGVPTDALLVGAGVVTAVPLLWFAAAAQRIPLSLVGTLQYITPTLQFLIGIWLYREPFDLWRLAGFSLVWIGLIVFVVDGVLARTRAPAGTPVTETL